jgi:tumor protein p53-inducible protein 3
MMRGVVVENEGKKIYVGECEKPKNLPKGSALITIYSTAINRADISQRFGKYPPPPGASDILGLEMSGIIEEIAEEEEEGNRSGFQVGDRVCGLLSGGGYAEYCVISLKHLIRVPPSIPLVVGL